MTGHVDVLVTQSDRGNVAWPALMESFISSIVWQCRQGRLKPMVGWRLGTNGGSEEVKFVLLFPACW